MECPSQTGLIRILGHVESEGWTQKYFWNFKIKMARGRQCTAEKNKFSLSSLKPSWRELGSFKSPKLFLVTKSHYWWQNLWLKIASGMQHNLCITLKMIFYQFKITSKKNKFSLIPQVKLERVQDFEVTQTYSGDIRSLLVTNFMIHYRTLNKA